MLSMGLSPRVRGNRRRGRSCLRGSGPIPACAGQPRRTSHGRSSRRAYPRVCGATVKAITAWLVSPGLSPRVRGNRLGLRNGPNLEGPIPACAGQPRRFALPRPSCTAYPRVCGATSSASFFSYHSGGLSPRVRGNPQSSAGRAPSIGPIPACAGQPQHADAVQQILGAYPRVCGATSGWATLILGVLGLSPRVRGNLFQSFVLLPLAGPIPACAGQPVQRGIFHRFSWAYPRVCGATPKLTMKNAEETGLSPRVRGNLLYLTH